MTDSKHIAEQDALRFINERIESVPHLEALLLLWNSKPKHWSAEELAKRLYVDPKAAQTVFRDLSRQNLISSSPDPPEEFFYESISEENDRVIAAVQAKYRTEIVAISNMIHRNVSSAVRDFADAFRFKKERE